jgi:hypothetical protein
MDRRKNEIFFFSVLAALDKHPRIHYGRFIRLEFKNDQGKPLIRMSQYNYGRFKLDGLNKGKIFPADAQLDERDKRTKNFSMIQETLLR